MLIIDEKHIVSAGINWRNTIQTIEDAVMCLHENDFAQPVKPYLRYRNKKNRIIAMPAFVGGEFNKAGIKWISSFPENINKGIPRAHSVVVLNDADTGQPIAIINTPLLSIIRTASVSGLVINYYDNARHLNDVTIGIIGFGPIGQYHLEMCEALLGDKLKNVLIYDIRKIDGSLLDGKDNINIVDSWEKAYDPADIFITCTVSDAPYINKQPKKGSLHLNVSLRDYIPETIDWFKSAIIVDDWEEVCREHTDIEMMHLEKGLQKEHTQSIVDVIAKNCIHDFDKDKPIMFNPMGMAVFDIAIGSHYYQMEANDMLV